MKIHRPLIDALASGLDATFNNNQPAEKVLDTIFRKSRKFGSRDRRWLAETFYFLVRWWRPLVEDLHGSWADEGQRFSEGDLRALIDQATATDLNLFFSSLKNKKRPTRESIPDWLDELGVNELGAEVWSSMLSALNQPAKVYLRVNNLKTDLRRLQEQLARESVETEKVVGVESALALKERKNVFSTEAYLNGLFEVQDAGSQLIAPLLQPTVKSRVIDACAGAGGKSLHLADLMKNSGRIVSLDIHEWKLKELRKRASRAGADTIETKLADSKTIKRLEGSADFLLLDVPCSGLGVLKRHPGTKWYLSSGEVERCRQTQTQILKEYSCLVKRGGAVVYATCSVLPSENEKQVQKFLSQNEGFGLEKEIKVSPFETDFDGFYAARMSRK